MVIDHDQLEGPTSRTIQKQNTELSLSFLKTIFVSSTDSGNEDFVSVPYQPSQIICPCLSAMSAKQVVLRGLMRHSRAFVLHYAVIL